MKQQLAGAVVLVSLVTTACTGPAASGQAPSSEAAATVKAPLSPAEARESLRAANVALAEAMAKKGSAEGIASSAAADAVLLLDGAYTLRGADAIRTKLSAEPLERDGVLSAEPIIWDISADGRMGYAVGQILLDSTGGAPGASAPAGPAGGAAPGASGAQGSAASAPAPGAPAAPPKLKPGKRYQRSLTVWTRTPDGPWQLAAGVLGKARGPLAVPPTFSIASTVTPPVTAPSAPSDVLAEAFAADSAFSDQSVREGMGIAFVTWAAPDAVIPGGPSGLFGHAAIQENYGPITHEQVDLRWEPKLGGAASSGDMAYTVGRAVSVSKGPDGKPETHYVKYLSVWRRQPDGQWRYVADSGNGNPGPEGP
ncbi:hypothetical protein JY651_39635 [Pyxidicoccus parkwayensis]|uniref:DUF4440 domain-containing protein n=1 Tax=Pyxidicoccus parkwayensis TaxID=2813578 RepID=A0ABX7NUV4_9BACT|nr:hypothetical protein [Pyxidicoccus parkwaysis]QSQ21247.1 hypothetical protein JY651_39635 [Pyxidicoccus parkwaysis]